MAKFLAIYFFVIMTYTTKELSPIIMVRVNHHRYSLLLLSNTVVCKMVISYKISKYFIITTTLQ